jgi:glycolate oxidase subunit GlcD
MKVFPAVALKDWACKRQDCDLYWSETERAAFGKDKWFASALPDVVALPHTAEAVAALLKFAGENQIPITPRGAGHGYVGGCVPVHGGISLSLERMNRILEVHPEDFVVVTQPGVITKELQDAVAKVKRYYPPDPASRADCSIGGNIATNAGGPRCLKYGVTRDYVLGLQVALMDGTLTRLGGRGHKNKTGFELSRLFVGSEGMLGIVTEATLKLLPLPEWRAALSFGYRTMEAAARAILALFDAGLLPSAVEIADAFTLQAARKRTGTKDFDGCEASLIVEVDGLREVTAIEIKRIREIGSMEDPVFIKEADGELACEQVWQTRREFSYSLRDTGLTKLNEDIVVPRSRLVDLIRFASALQKELQIPIACFGHAGDGNIHVNVMIDENDPRQIQAGDKALDRLFEQVINWGGALTGEHGVGLAKKPWWPLAADKSVQSLHKKIKTALDPQHLLNPGKFLD